MTGGTVDVLDPSGTTLISRTKHYFYGDPTNSTGTGTAPPFDYPAWNDGKEYQTETIDTANCTPATCATVLRKTVNTWEQGVTVSPWSSTIANNPRVHETTLTLLDASPNLISKQTFGYDDSVPFNNQNNIKEYDFGSGGPGSLLRETQTTYLTSSTYTGTGVHIRNLPLQVSVYNGSYNEKARTTFEYDNYTLDGTDCQHSFHCPLLARSSVSGFDTSFNSSYTTRGNGTATTQYLLVNGSVAGSISAYSHYDVLGNVVKSLDPRSTTSNFIATTFEYEDRFGVPDGNAETPITPSELSGLNSFAYPAKITNAAGHITYTQLDYYIGKPVDGEDANGIVASGYYNDALDRPTQIRRAVGTSLQNQTTSSYDDTNRIVTTTSDRDANNDNVFVSKVFYDPFGRSIETRQYEGGTNYIATQTQYDALGRAYKISNPFRQWQSETAIWTTQAFDALGRMISVTTPDSAVVSTSYLGNAVTVSDQLGKQRKSVTDALGRLIQVYEAPNDSNYNYPTSYGYDTLDNLTTVSQGSQTRTFVYDSLKRLTSATNPESGTVDTVSYQYDEAGNLLVKTDPRSASTHFAYDALNRLTRRWYNASSSTTQTTNNSPALPSGVGASDEANFYYDAQSLPTGAPSFTRGASIGRLVAVTYAGTSSTTGDYLDYDSVGRNILKIQRTGSVNYQLSTTYNIAGAPTSVTYPSGHSVTYNYDLAGRLADKDAQNLAFTGNCQRAFRIDPSSRT